MEEVSGVFLVKILPFVLATDPKSLIGAMLGSHNSNISLFSCILLKILLE